MALKVTPRNAKGHTTYCSWPTNANDKLIKLPPRTEQVVHVEGCLDVACWHNTVGDTHANYSNPLLHGYSKWRRCSGGSRSGFFSPVQWPQQPQLNHQSCRGVHNWACAADDQQQREEAGATGPVGSCSCTASINAKSHQSEWSAVVVHRVM